jgi:hypothetical protein
VLRSPCQFEVWKPLQQTNYRNLALESRQRHTETTVNPCCKCQVRVRLPPNVESLRIRESFRIPVRRSNAECNHRTRRQLDATDLHILGHFSIAKLIRTLVTEYLLDRRPD